MLLCGGQLVVVWVPVPACLVVVACGAWLRNRVVFPTCGAVAVETVVVAVVDP